MEGKVILVVDDEKNIRLTMTQTLEPLGMIVETAINGEEALQKLRARQFGLVFLDLKMPGMDGMDVLRIIKDEYPGTRVIIITAHGTIETAVEAMKLGAADFIQKPFSPVEIKNIAALVMKREDLEEETAVSYDSLIELTKRNITDRNFSKAKELARNAISANPTQPEAYNLLGALYEIEDDIPEAQKFYRAALSIDPSFLPARDNLERTAYLDEETGINLGPGDSSFEH